MLLRPNLHCICLNIIVGEDAASNVGFIFCCQRPLENDCPVIVSLIFGDIMQTHVFCIVLITNFAKLEFDLVADDSTLLSHVVFKSKITLNEKVIDGFCFVGNGFRC